MQAASDFNIENKAAPPAALALRKTVVRFGDLVALNEATFHVPSGSITGLVGRNGAGKSTSIHLLAGLLNPDSGAVEIFGKGFDEAAREIKQNTGYLLSEPALFSYLTPVETLCFLAEAYGVSRAEGKQRAEDLLAFFELSEARNRVADWFSTGMQKRLALAAALVHSPRLLVLDEPFESLDPLIVRKIKQLLVSYVRGGGSVLLSSHLIDAVDEICDRVVILDRGRVIVEDATAEAKAGVAGRLGAATLEELYASVVETATDADLTWLQAQ